MSESVTKHDKGMLVIGILIWILGIECWSYIQPYFQSFGSVIWDPLKNVKYWAKDNSVTDWLQAIWGMGSLVVALLVGWITFTYNKNSEIQNRLAFEQFKPELEPSPQVTGVRITNKWNFDASKLVVYCKGVAMRNGELSESVAKDDSKMETFLFSQGGNLSVSAQQLCPSKDYFSLVVLYANYVSGVAYFKGFNYLMWGNDLRNIGEGSESIEGTLPSPLAQSEFEPFIKKASLREQLEWKVSFADLEKTLDEIFQITKTAP